MGHGVGGAEADGAEQVLAPARAGVRDGGEDVAELQQGGHGPGGLGAELVLPLQQRDQLAVEQRQLGLGPRPQPRGQAEAAQPLQHRAGQHLLLLDGGRLGPPVAEVGVQQEDVSGLH